jgi:hypothetical protein
MAKKQPPRKVRVAQVEKVVNRFIANAEANAARPRPPALQRKKFK